MSAPVTQRRGVDAFTAQDRTDPSGLCRKIGRGQNAQLVAGGERSPPGRPDNSGDTEAGAATIVGLRPPFMAAPASASVGVWSMGMSEMILQRLRV